MVSDAHSAPSPQSRAELKRSRKPKEKSLLSWIGTSVSAAVLLLVAAVGVLTIILPAVVGGTALTVLTNSMAPKYPPGTLIVIKPTPLDEIKIGDVLTYQIKSGEPAVISHRVIQRSVTTEGDTYFLTKGDNNSDADPNPVQEIQVKGTLWYAIPWLGWVNNGINGQGRTLLVPIAAGLLFAYAGYTVISSVVGRRRKARARAARAAADENS